MTCNTESTPRQFSDPDPEVLRSWLALWRVPGVGPALFRELLKRFGSAQEVLKSPASRLRNAGINEQICAHLQNVTWQDVDKDIRWQEASNHHVLLEHNSHYPALLREIPDPPPLLFVHGNPAVLGQFQLAMVGSRNPSSGGSRTAMDFSQYLSTSGLHINSGLAGGIDAASHLGALQGGGVTIAVMGTGPDQIYPAINRNLAEQIVEAGALVTEYPLGTPPRPAHFPQRNRIISGLSLGTLVVEAAPRSGSLITARHAIEQGREVFAIPGSIHNPLARGCHGLIRQGAKLVETAQDILEELGPLAGTVSAPQNPSIVENPLKLDNEYVQLLDSMGFEPTTIDQLVNRSGLTPEAVSSMLLILELQEYVTSSDGGLYHRVSKEGLK